MVRKGRARHVLRGDFALDGLVVGGLQWIVEILEALSLEPPQVMSARCWREIGTPQMGTLSEHRCVP